MNNFKDGGFNKRGKDFGGKPKYQGDRKDNNRLGGSKFSGQRSGGKTSETFKAECSKCQKSCTLPFRPNGEKPVFCSDCFAKKNFDSDRGDSRRDNDRGKRSEYSSSARDQHSSQNARPQTQPNKDIIEIKRQLSTIESRLNRILDIINPPAPQGKSIERIEVEMVTAPEKKIVSKIELKNSVKQAVTKKAPAKAAKKEVTKKAVKKVVKKGVKKASKKR